MTGQARRTKWEISKIVANQLRRKFDGLMASFNARPTSRPGWYDIEIDTPLGLLWIGYPDERFGSIMSRFEDSERSSQGIHNVNPYTGKWNHHPSKSTADEMFLVFEQDIRHLMALPTKPIE